MVVVPKPNEPITQLVDMVLLNDENDLQCIKQNNPLFYDDCQPDLQQSQETGDRYAMLCDVAQQALLVVCQRYPYRDNPIVVTALVVRHIRGLEQCIQFLRHVIRVTHPWANGIQLPHTVTLHVSNGVTARDIDDAFVGLGFMPR